MANLHDVAGVPAFANRLESEFSLNTGDHDGIVIDYEERDMFFGETGLDWFLFDAVQDPLRDSVPSGRW